MAHSSVTIFSLYLVTFALCSSSIHSCGKLSFMHTKNSNLPRATRVSTPNAKGHATAIHDGPVIARHLGTIHRILDESVPSPGVGN